MARSGERAVAGVTCGLLGLNDSVAWEARHLGVRMRLESRIVAFSRPVLFVDEQVRGPFARLRHEHRFEAAAPAITVMTDVFDFAAPLGAAGRIAEALFLTRYMRSLLAGHTSRLKDALESDDWQQCIQETA